MDPSRPYIFLSPPIVWLRRKMSPRVRADRPLFSSLSLKSARVSLSLLFSPTQACYSGAKPRPPGVCIPSLAHSKLPFHAILLSLSVRAHKDEAVLARWNSRLSPSQKANSRVVSGVNLLKKCVSAGAVMRHISDPPGNFTHFSCHPRGERDGKGQVEEKSSRRNGPWGGRPPAFTLKSAGNNGRKNEVERELGPSQFRDTAARQNEENSFLA